MAKGQSPTRFRKRELDRAIRAAISAGGTAVEVDPTTGKILVRLGKPGDAPPSDANPWDEVHAANQKRPA
jgi:hypothetical protein